MIDFYYWGTQCPYNKINLDILKSIEDKEEVKINYHDIGGNPELAKKLNLFSPTLTVFDNKVRWAGPLTTRIVEDYLKGEMPKRRPYRVEPGKEVIRGELKFLTPDNCIDIKGICSPSKLAGCCLEKGTWMKEIMDKYQLPHLGVINCVDNACVGGAEFTPSLEVPYDIPKSEETAFLTCVYLSDPEYDYKSYPLEALEKELKKIGYRYLQAIVSEDIVFPNGPLSWFKDKGFEDLGEIHYEEREGARQHLMRKELE